MPLSMHAMHHGLMSKRSSRARAAFAPLDPMGHRRKALVDPTCCSLYRMFSTNGIGFCCSLAEIANVKTGLEERIWAMGFAPASMTISRSILLTTVHG